MNFMWIDKLTLVSELATEHGFCINLNLAISSEMYHEDIVAADFYHEYFSLSWYEQDNGIKIPRRIKSSASLVVHVSALQTFYDMIYNGHHDGHLLYVHHPYELPMKSSSQIFMHKDVLLKVLIEPKLNFVDESLNDLSVDE